MVEQGDLFNPKTIERFCEDVKPSSIQKQSANEWLQLLQENKLEDEKSNYPKFMQIILQDILGYPIKEIEYEKGNVEFQFGTSDGKNVLCFEAKGTSTKDLFVSQHRVKKEHETPIKQTWDYMGSIGLDYGICTNYKDFVLITKQYGYSKYHFFNFNSIKGNEEKLKEFIGIFSKERIIEKGFVEKLYEESVIEEREFTKEFYKLFHETRLMLIKAFQQKENVTKNDAIYFTQIFLNRLIFIFFVEDRGFLPDTQLFSNRILNLLETSQFTEHSKKIYEDIKELFIAFDKGSRVLGVFGFNGALFSGIMPEKIYFSDLKESGFFDDVKQNSNLLKSTKLNEKATEIIKKHPDLNPIISNLLIMDSFNFNSELNVNILGHIFEQSISDLEELKQEEVSRRKKEGVFYTPEYVTDYICRNTIIPYLSKSGITSVSDLLNEYEDNIEELEEKFKQIKILDPACGSGAFLVKAVNVLLEIYKEIQNRKGDDSKYSGDQLQITHEWDENKEVRAIIENNIYGVDINPESIDITKLSLFLKLASNERKLIGLTKNIKVGNSLIDDKSIISTAFSWEDSFPEILGPLIKDKGFDIVIGNPPYIRVQFLDHNHIDWFKKHKETAYKRIDASGLFFELAKNVLKKDGLVSYITSNQFLVAEYGKKTRKFLLEKFEIKNIIDFGDLRVFEDASTYVGIFSLKNSKPSDFLYKRVPKEELGRVIDLNNSVKMQLKGLGEESWILGKKSLLELMEKIKKHKKLQKIGNAATGVITGKDEVFVFTKKQLQEEDFEKELFIPILEGGDPERYMPITPKNFVIYPYKFENKKTILLTEDELSRKYPKTYQYLLANKNKLNSRKDSRKKFGGKKWFGLVRFGQLANFYREKIVSPGEVREHKFTIDTTKSCYLNARVFSILIDDKDYTLKYVLGLLNSKVIRFFYQNTAPKKQGGYFSISGKFVNDIPIAKATQTIQKEIADKVDKILEYNVSIDHKLKEFLDLLKINHKIKLNKRIEGFYFMEFSEFIKELSKQNIKLSLNDQSEMRNYFLKKKNEIAELQKNTSKLEKEIDEFIFKVYEINDEERHQIEEFCKK